MTWWQRLWNRRLVERRLDAELRDHVDRLVADLIAEGLAPNEAMRRARLEFGGFDQVKEDCRDARGTEWVHDSARDLRFAVRVMARDPWLTAVIVVSLALGIGVCSLAFTITDAYFFRGLPVAHPDRMFHAGTVDAKGEHGGVSFPDYADWKSSLSDVDMAAYEPAQMLVGEPGRAADRVSGARVSSDVFRLLEVTAAHGRVFGPADEADGRRAVLVGYRLWVQRYASDPALPGRTILVNDVPATVLGVMPDGFGFPSREELWMPLTASSDPRGMDRGDRSLSVLARLHDDQNPRAVASAWHATAAQLAAGYPDTNTGIDVEIVRFGQHQMGRLTESPATMLPIAAGIVLVIACTNVANLLLARATTRTRELVIRASVGATRWRIVRQLLVESVLLALAGGAIGFGLAVPAVNAIAASFFTGYVPYWMTFEPGVRSFVAVGVLCGGSTIVFGLAPAVRAATRGTSGVTLSGVRSHLSVRRDPWSARLVAAQFALAVTILGGAGLLVQRYGALLMEDGAIDARRYITASIVPPEATDPSGDRRTDFYSQLEPRLAAIPGVESVAFASTTPFLPAPTRTFAVRDMDAGGDRTLNAQFVAVSAGYFEALSLPLLRGRAFEPADGETTSNVAIVNALFAERHFPGSDPIGRQIRIDTPDDGTRAGVVGLDVRWRTVIGVAPTIRQTVASGPRPIVYVPHSGASASSVQVILRMPTQSAGTIAAVRAAVAGIDDGVLLLSVRSLTEPLRNSRLQPHLMATVAGSLALVALFLSTVGLYAIVSHGVRQRTAEIGLRLALGGRPAQIVWLFVRQGLTPIVAGLLFGLAGAFGVGQLLRARLVGTSAADPATFASLVAMLAVVTVTACLVPAWRGSRVDPATTLRQD